MRVRLHGLRPAKRANCACVVVLLEVEYTLPKVPFEVSRFTLQKKVQCCVCRRDIAGSESPSNLGDVGAMVLVCSRKNATQVFLQLHLRRCRLRLQDEQNQEAKGPASIDSDLHLWIGVVSCPSVL